MTDQPYAPAALDNKTRISTNYAMKQKPSYKLRHQIRQAINDCGMSRYAISQITGIDQAALSRFMHGQVGLGLDALDRLSECLQLVVTMDRKASKKGK